MSWAPINMGICIVCLVVLALIPFHHAASPSPADQARLVSRQILQHKEKFLFWHYGGAIVFDALHQVNQTFGLNYQPLIETWLDKYIQDPSSYAYQVLHNQSIPWYKNVGDEIGLFPINYLGRILSRSGNPIYDNTTDLYIVNTVANKYVMGYPTRLPEGTWCRKYGWEGGAGNFLWADDMFMGSTLLARLAAIQRNLPFAEALAEQALTFSKHLQDPDDGLFFHGYSAALNRTNCCKWGRGNGWAFMANVQILKAMSGFPSLASSEKFSRLLAIVTRMADGLVKTQAPDGRWRQVVDVSSTYLESSGTAMFITALAQGIRYGFLPVTLLPVIEKGWNGLSLAISDDGVVNGVCSGTGLLLTVSEYNGRPTDYLESANGGIGAVMYAAVEMQKLQRSIMLNRI